MRYLLFVALYLTIFESLKAAPVIGQHCVKNSFDKTWGDLRHQVAIMKDDQRWGIDEGSRHYKFSSSEAEYLKSLVGEVRCRSKLNGKEYLATGVLIGPSKIVTSAHTFLTKGLKFGVDKCSYTSRTSPPLKRTISLGSKVAKFGTLDADADFNNDFAIAHLDTPIEGVRPMRFREPRGFFPVENVYLLSAQSTAMRRQIKPGEAIIQRCGVNHSAGADVESGSVGFTDCSAAGGESGSLAFVREADGSFAAVGMARDTGDGSKDNQPYSYESNNFTGILGFDGKFGDALATMPRD